MWLTAFLLSTLVLGIHSEEIPGKKRVCIIGAGPSGLTSAKQISRLNDFEPVVFERNSEIGGQWLYSEKGDIDKHGLPVNSGIYKYMRINFPKQIMTFPDYQEMHGENRSYIRHEDFFEYFQNYTKHFNIRRFIQFDTLVEEVDFRNNTNDWKLKVKNLNTHVQREISCEAVMVCSGIFLKPNIPEIPGIESFTGRVLHSHEYRRPEEFSYQTVGILGASISGLDITGDLNGFAKTIYLSSRHDKMNGEVPDFAVQVPGIVSADNDGLNLSNGSKINVDSLIFCTGYLYDYPFLKSSSGIMIDDGKYVHPLYKSFINIEHPTMAFISLPNKGPFIQLAYVQASYFAALLEGKVKLPSRSEMLKDSELPEGTPKKNAHVVVVNAIPYYNEFAQAAGAEPLPDTYVQSFYVGTINNMEHPITFKERDVYTYANGSGEVKCVHPSNNCKNKMYEPITAEGLSKFLKDLV